MKFDTKELNSLSDYIHLVASEYKEPNCQIYHIDTKNIPNYITSIIEDLKRSFQRHTHFNMRSGVTRQAVESCIEVVDYCIRIFRSELPLKVKIWIFHHLNILGYTFDRQPESYTMCYHILTILLDEVQSFEKRLSADELKIWHCSIYAGRELVPFMRGWMNGILAAINARYGCEDLKKITAVNARVRRQPLSGSDCYLDVDLTQPIFENHR